MKSDNMKCGLQQAPARSLLNALGYTKEEIKKPMVGIVCSYNEIVPGHRSMRRYRHGTYRYEVQSCYA